LAVYEAGEKTLLTELLLPSGEGLTNTSKLSLKLLAQLEKGAVTTPKAGYHNQFKPVWKVMATNGAGSSPSPFTTRACCPCCAGTQGDMDQFANRSKY